MKSLFLLSILKIFKNNFLFFIFKIPNKNFIWFLNLQIKKF